MGIETKLIRAIKDLDATIQAEPRGGLVHPDPKDVRNWQRNILTPALTYARKLVEDYENGPHVLMSESGLWYTDTGYVVDKKHAQLFYDKKEAEYTASLINLKLVNTKQRDD